MNIIKSNFLIKDSYFENTNADALDIDFSNGKIGDKAISVGEQSKIIISNSYIQASHFGLVAKDKSVIEGNNITITNNDIGVAAYIKKSEYGPAEIKLTNSQLEKNEINIFNQKFSKIKINNKDIDSINCKNEKKVCSYVLEE